MDTDTKEIKSLLQAREMKPPFRIVVKARRLSWLPSIWPNTSWIVMESPPGTTWQEAHNLAHQFKDAGALFVQVQGAEC